VKARIRKCPSGSIGSRTFRSTTTKAASSTTAPADQRADGERPADRRAVDGQRTRPLARLRERVRQERERDGEHDRAADALHRAGGVEHGDAVGECRGERRDGEDPETDREQPPPAEPVGQRAGREDDRGERERVRVDDPLDAAEVGVKVACDARDGGVDDRDVEHEHRGRDRYDSQCYAL
jgi:hypothetical protein